jgi:phosphatidate cytidylyltransferase
MPQIYFVELGAKGFALALVLAAPLAVFTHLYWGHEDRARMWIAIWIGPLLTLPLVWLWHVWDGWGTRGLVALVLLAKVGDIAGYYVGSAIGVRRPFPRISPGKTVAGCWASFAVGTLAGGALVTGGVLPAGSHGVWGGFTAGAAVNLAAQAGDLLESWLKRGAGVKDSGSWFGPSGGVLDLVDSLLLAVPAALVFWPLVLA